MTDYDSCYSESAVRDAVLAEVQRTRTEAARKATAAREQAPAPLTVYRAASGAIPLGLYTTDAAARAHCEDDARRYSPGGAFEWAVSEDDPDTIEMDVRDGRDGSRTFPTGYTVTPLYVADAYDPEADA